VKPLTAGGFRVTDCRGRLVATAEETSKFRGPAGIAGFRGAIVRIPAALRSTEGQSTLKKKRKRTLIRSIRMTSDLVLSALLAASVLLVQCAPAPDLVSESPPSRVSRLVDGAMAKDQMRENPFTSPSLGGLGEHEVTGCIRLSLAMNHTRVAPSVVRC
jgi:hypothetical protein